MNHDSISWRPEIDLEKFEPEKIDPPRPESSFAAREPAWRRHILDSRNASRLGTGLSEDDFRISDKQIDKNSMGIESSASIPLGFACH